MHYGLNFPSALNYDPFKAIVAPRPIGWIGTRNGAGNANLAPYSFFGAIATYPHMVYFAAEGLKHSALNARDQKEFTFSMVSHDLVQQMNVTSQAFPAGVSEFEKAGLTMGESVEIDAPFVAESPAAFECVTLSVTQLEDREGTKTDRHMVIGQVVQFHIRDEFIRDGRFDTQAARPVSRLGYRDYDTVEEPWELIRPDD